MKDMNMVLMKAIITVPRTDPFKSLKKSPARFRVGLFCLGEYPIG